MMETFLRVSGNTGMPLPFKPSVTGNLRPKAPELILISGHPTKQSYTISSRSYRRFGYVAMMHILIGKSIASPRSKNTSAE